MVELDVFEKLGTKFAESTFVKILITNKKSL